MIAVIVILLILAIIVGGVAFYYFTQRESKPSGGPSGGPSPGPSGGSSTSTLTITENGTTLTENYQIMPKREKYIQVPFVQDCYVSGIATPEYCSTPGLHDRSTDGSAYVYDLSIKSREATPYTECPGGGHECWYIEKFDQNGNLVDIVDKNGVKLLDKMADDIWADKWDDTTLGYAKETVEYKDGKLIAVQDIPIGQGNRIVPAGQEFFLKDAPVKSAYFMMLLVALKIAGQPKPERIVLNVAGVKASFDFYITARSERGV